MLYPRLRAVMLTDTSFIAHLPIPGAKQGCNIRQGSSMAAARNWEEPAERCVTVLESAVAVSNNIDRVDKIATGVAVVSTIADLKEAIGDKFDEAFEDCLEAIESSDFWDSPDLDEIWDVALTEISDLILEAAGLEFIGEGIDDVIDRFIISKLENFGISESTASRICKLVLSPQSFIFRKMAIGALSLRTRLAHTTGLF
ncbi:unnamed protein product [Owenia fusiformis]|uniref:Uncharacterized protein n=1 Tax=Owenia fusiformis TaxID=6347 RepID=A0A8S4QAH4_OWEFU|nr:unnamed protein product [Owenia fusiformis]